MSSNASSLETLRQMVGQELAVSDWITIDQHRINSFADSTNDHQWIHVDVERAKKESPFGTTIAHGFLTLSLLAFFQTDTGIFPDDVAQIVNYGLDKVRFIAPVRVGKRIRNRSVLLSIEDKGNGVLVKTQNTIEIEGEDKPAMVAEALALLM